MALNIRLEGRKCLVIGGGEVGERKIRTLLSRGAKVRLVSLALSPGLEEMVRQGLIEYAGSEYDSSQLTGVFLVFAASSDGELNRTVALECLEKGILVNVADQPELGDVILPASFSRGDLTLSISTGGKSPALAANIKKKLAQQFGDEYGRFLELLGLVRNKVLAQGRPSVENRKIFRMLVDSDLVQLLAGEDDGRAEKRLVELLGSEFNFFDLGFVKKKEDAAC